MIMRVVKVGILSTLPVWETLSSISQRIKKEHSQAVVLNVCVILLPYQEFWEEFSNISSPFIVGQQRCCLVC